MRSLTTKDPLEMSNLGVEAQSAMHVLSRRVLKSSNHFHSAGVPVWGASNL